MATSSNGGRFHSGGFFKMRPEDMAAFREGMQREFARQRQERNDRFEDLHTATFNSTGDEMPGSNNDQRREKVDPKTGRKFKNLNHPIPQRAEPLHNKVVVHQAALAHYLPGTHHVTLPRRGRLGDIRLCDESGQPLNIGPTPRGPTEFRTVDAALDHFRRVARNFDKLNGYGVDP